MEANKARQLYYEPPIPIAPTLRGEETLFKEIQYPRQKIIQPTQLYRGDGDMSSKANGGERQYVRKIQRKEALVSNAFNVDYEKTIPDDVLYDDIVSYLGEFRFQLQTFEYHLFFGPSDTSNEWKIRDTKTKEAMSDKAKETLRQKSIRHEASLREEAELRGLEKLDNRLLTAKEGETVVWASPPGSKEDGYGNYGFIFNGSVEKNANGTLHLSMTARRVDVTDEERKSTMLAKFNDALSKITNKDMYHSTAENFIAEPELVKEGVSQATIESTLKKIFPSQVNKRQQEIFQHVISDSQLLITDVIHILKHGTLEERVHAFTQLEGYALEQKQKHETEQSPIHIERSMQTVYEKPKPLIRLQNVFSIVYSVPVIQNSSCPIMSNGTRATSSIGVTANLFNSMGSINSMLMSGGRASEVGDCPKVTCRKCGWQPNMSEESALTAGLLKECPAVIVNDATGEKEKCGWSPS